MAQIGHVHEALGEAQIHLNSRLRLVPGRAVDSASLFITILFVIFAGVLAF
jgi:hypothetical protein